MGVQYSQSSKDRPPNSKSKITKTVALFDRCDRRRSRVHDVQITMGGGTETGKSCLCERISRQGGTYIPMLGAKIINGQGGTYVSMVGMEVVMRTIELDDKRIRVNAIVLDSFILFSGERSLSALCRGAMGLILVFSVTDRKSFADITRLWCQDSATSGNKKHYVLIGNKCDLESQRRVGYMEAKDFAAEKGMLYIEVSAKDGTNVELILPTLLSLMGKV